jgi:hypothetical protein
MTKTETEKFLRAEIDEVFSIAEKYYESLSGTPAPPVPEGEWDHGLTLEHIYLVNHYLLILIEKMAAKARRAAETNSISQAEDYSLISPPLKEIADPASFEWEAPAHMEPTGNMTPEESLARIREQKCRLLEVLDSLPDGAGVGVKMMMSVNSIGRIDLYQYIYFLLQHIRRHIG